MSNYLFYAVQNGRQTGLFPTWEECSSQVKGYSGASYRGFYDAKNAIQYLDEDVDIASAKGIVVISQKSDDAVEDMRVIMRAVSNCMHDHKACVIQHVAFIDHKPTNEYEQKFQVWMRKYSKWWCTYDFHVTEEKVEPPVIAKPPAEIKLNNQQEKAVEESMEFFNDDDRICHVLRGYAGTGKTTISRVLAKMLKEKDHMIYFLAPTNKAVVVLRTKNEDLRNDGLLIEFNTVHKALYDTNPKTGAVTLKDHPFGNGSFIFIDEASMLTDPQLTQIVNAAKECDSHILFLGDEFQLPPVSKESNPATVWNQGWSESVLTQVVRQASDSYVLALATCIRGFKHPVRLNQNQICRNGESMQLVQHTEEACVKSYINHYANGDLIGLAFSNRKRQALNQKIRARLGFSGVINSGEKIISIANSTDKQNGETMEVEDLTIMKQVTLHYRQSDGRIVPIDAALCEIDNHKVIFVQDTCGNASVYHQGISNPRVLPSNWLTKLGSDDYAIAAEVVIATYGYVITIHKSQGSQWKRVYLFENCYSAHKVGSEWIPRDNCLEFTARGMYTAVTRAEETVILSNDAVIPYWDRRGEIFMEGDMESILQEADKFSK